METNTTTNAGKGLGVAGFVISLVALVLWIFINGAAVLSAVVGGGMGLAIFWIIVSLLGALLAVMGFMRAKSGNGKKGLAITGLILGILATGLSVRTVFSVKEVHAATGDLSKQFEKLGEGMTKALDSVNKELGTLTSDTTAQK